MSAVKQVEFITLSRPSKTSPGQQRIELRVYGKNGEPDVITPCGIIQRTRMEFNFTTFVFDANGTPVKQEETFRSRSKAGHFVVREYFKQTTALTTPAAAPTTTEETVTETPVDELDRAGDAIEDEFEKQEISASDVGSVSDVLGSPEAPAASEAQPEVDPDPSVPYIIGDQLFTKGDAATVLGITREELDRRAGIGKLKKIGNFIMLPRTYNQPE